MRAVAAQLRMAAWKGGSSHGLCRYLLVKQLLGFSDMGCSSVQWGRREQWFHGRVVGTRRDHIGKAPATVSGRATAQMLVMFTALGLLPVEARGLGKIHLTPLLSAALFLATGTGQRWVTPSFVYHPLCRMCPGGQKPEVRSRGTDFSLFQPFTVSSLLTASGWFLPTHPLSSPSMEPVKLTSVVMERGLTAFPSTEKMKSQGDPTRNISTTTAAP